MTSPLWAVDAGGTTTTLELAGERTTFGSVNPASVGPETAHTTLTRLLATLAEALDGRAATGWFATATCPLPAADDVVAQLVERVRRAGVRGTVLVSNDIVPLLAAPPLGGRGVALVCGTGSGLLACDGQELVHRVGGCEYLGSDEGSAFHLGLAGLRAAVRATDGRGPATAIGQELANRFGTGVQDAARALAGVPYPKHAVAALAPLVCRAWSAGDAVAASVVSDVVDELVAGARAAAAGARLRGSWSLAIGGGVPHGSPEFAALLRQRLRELLDPVDIVETTDPVAAALSALDAGGRGSGPLPAPLRAVVGQAESTDAASPYGRRSGGGAPRSRRQPRARSPIELGLCLAAWGETDLDTAMGSAAELGADAVDLPTDSTASLVDLARWARAPGYRQHLRAAARTVPVTCVSNSRDTQLLLGPHGPHTDAVLEGPAWAKRQHALDRAMDTVRLAADLGAPHARLMFGVPDHSRWLSWSGSEVSWEDNLAQWCEEAEPVLALAADHGVTVLVEPHPKQTLYDPCSARALLDAVARTGRMVRLCVDPANLAAVGHHPVDAVRGWGPWLAAAHAKDLQLWTRSEAPAGAGWSRYGPGPAVRFRALGAGALPWPAIVSALQDEEFTGVLYVEHEDALLPRRQSAEHSLRYLRELLPQSAPEGRTW
ncbi:TIM barrel protein [Streptomyces zhihengii]|uniref:TIM barrel protein n=1 Tax=Streptomyces zhihengii TaxID=1818004 RepID=UPI0033A1AECD